MANDIEIKVPDIGGANQVDVIEILVQVGQEISIDTPLVTLESDKASMEIPSSHAGVVTSINLKIGDKVSEGDLILVAKSELETEKKETQTSVHSNESVETAAESDKKTSTTHDTIELVIPDIGGATDVDVIDVLVKAGMQVQKDDALVTLEGDKATMDIPSPYTGTIKEVLIKLGDKVAQGSPILIIAISEEQSNEIISQDIPQEVLPVTTKQEKRDSNPEKLEIESQQPNGALAAGPAVRRMARELGVDLSLVTGKGRKSRITKEDLQDFIKSQLKKSTNPSGGFSIPENPSIDFSKFGAIESKPLSKIKRSTGINVHRSWITVPHVTQFDEADITNLEAFRKSEADSSKDAPYKLTLLAFVCAAVTKALHIFPQFNASLDSTGENLILKQYFNIGIAVETPNGLVVPVIKNVDTLSIGEIAQEMARLSSKARNKSLTPGDMTGGCFTISSLGGIGGTAFTPIVNSPEVAILGLSRSTIKPVYVNGEFIPKLMLPLSLSYDHRVIDGAEAARFTRYLSEALGDIRKILL